MIKNILVAVDGSEYGQVALNYGAELAKAFKATVRLLYVIDIRILEWPSYISSDGFTAMVSTSGSQVESQEFMRQKGEEIIARSSRYLEEREVQFQPLTITGSPAQVICDQAHFVDLVLMGRRGEYARWDGKLLGATLESVVRRVIKPIMMTTGEFYELNGVLAAYDDSSHANHALGLAAYFSKRLAIPLTILVVDDDEEKGRTIGERAREYVTSYQIPVAIRHQSGKPAESIISVSAEADFGLVAMGAYGHTRIRELILGSTTDEVMRTAAKPLLLMK
jgi:nucleotide-binding universal stress UspA family protein